MATSVLLATLAGLTVPEFARAQGLFDFLFGAFRARAYNYEQPYAHYGREPRVIRPAPHVPRDERHAPQRSGASSVAYCVRICDGRYFPLPASSRSEEATPAKLCSALCPAAETTVYSGSSIDHAVARDGKPYKSLENAFLYRDKIVTDCTCNGHDTNGTARLDPKEDPTLRPGDIIVTADGPLVFKGSRNAKRTASDFIAAEDDRSLPKSVRATLSGMRIGPISPAATAKSEPATPDGDSAMRGALKPQQN